MSFVNFRRSPPSSANQISEKLGARSPKSKFVAHFFLAVTSQSKALPLDDPPLSLICRQSASVVDKIATSSHPTFEVH